MLPFSNVVSNTLIKAMHPPKTSMFIKLNAKIKQKRIACKKVC